MNALNIGLADKYDWLLSKAAPPFLFIGKNTDPFLTHRVKVFDPERHHFDPLMGITPERAVDLADIIFAADPGGDSTLTVRNGKQALAEMLVTTTRLDQLTGESKDPAQAEALRIVRALLFFPTLKGILCGGKPFDFSGSVVAAIDPAILGRKQSLLLTQLLISQHTGQIILEDGGRYLRPVNLSLIDQNRLVCGVDYMSRLGGRHDLLRLAVLGIQDKIGRRCTYEDAADLASYDGVMPGTNYFAFYVGERMG